MALLDPTSKITMMRLRCGDTRDIPFLPDEVYCSALDEKKGDIKSASILCAQYILAQLAFKTRAKMVQLEVFGGDAFKQYQEYLLMIVKNPDFSGISPIPYSATGPSPINEFQKDWDKSYECGCNGGVLPL